MPKGPEGQQRPADVIGNAILVARIATGEVEEFKPERSGRMRSGIAGAKARNENLTTGSAPRSQKRRQARVGDRMLKMENLGSKELQALKERLSEFDISVSKGVDGNVTVSTACEPFFCFERSSIEELQTLVRDTLTSYAATFYNVTDLKVAVTIQPARVDLIPIEERVISSRLVPSFARSDDTLELA